MNHDSPKTLWGFGVGERNNEDENANHYSIFGLSRDNGNGKNVEITVVYRGFTGIMEKNMEATIIHWGFIGINVGSCRAWFLFHTTRPSSS